MAISYPFGGKRTSSTTSTPTSTSQSKKTAGKRRDKEPGASTAPLPNRVLGLRAISTINVNEANTWAGEPIFTGANIFCENSGASTTWDQNLGVVDFEINKYTGFTEAGGVIDWAIPICSQSQPMTETTQGLYDTQIRAMAQKIANFDKNKVILVRPGWEANHLTAFPWSYNKAGGYEEFISAYRRVVSIFKSVSKRFRFGWVLVTTPGVYNGSFDWKLGYPGDDVVDWIGVDPYYTSNSGRTEEADFRLKWDNPSKDDDISSYYAFARARNKGFAVPECGTNFNGGTWIRMLFQALSTLEGVTHVFYWDRNYGVVNGDFEDKITDDSKPLVSAAFKEETLTGSAWARNKIGAYNVPQAIGTDLLAAWQADRASLITQVSGVVSSFRDRKLFYDLNQATAGARPTPGPNYLSFTGAQLLQNTALGIYPIAPNNDFEIWGVFKNEEVATGTARILFAVGSGGFATQIRLSRLADGKMGVGIGRGGSSVTTVSSPNVIGTDPVYFRVIVEPDGTTLEINGVAGTKVAAVPSVSGTEVYMGALATVASPFIGKIRDIYVTKPLRGQTDKIDRFRSHISMRSQLSWT